MTEAIFLCILLILAIVDRYKFTVPNVVVLPAIVVGCWIAGHYFWPMIMFWLTSLFYAKKIWGGGDVKVFAMVGAFTGVWAIWILVGTVMIIHYMRKFRRYNKPMAVTPIVLIASLVILATIRSGVWTL